VVYGVDIDCLEEAVMALLQEKKLSFSAAESCTGGDIARRFTELPGASAFFKGGVVSYVNEVKEAMLGVDSALLEEKTAVCREVAAAMAEGVRARLHTDLAVSVTGLAGPDGGGVHEVGTVFVGLAVEGKTFVREMHTGSRSRAGIRRAAGDCAFDMMRRWMQGLPVENDE
jgi:nicotinamide-nucleotide amidase